MRRPRTTIFALGSVALAATSCIRFVAPTTFATSTVAAASVSQLAVVDVTGNGLGDVLVESNGSLIRFESCGPGCLTSAQTIPNFGLGLLGDFDGDGIHDLLRNDTIYWGGPATGDRPAGFSLDDASPATAFGDIRYDTQVGDFDGDGNADILRGFDFVGHIAWNVALGDGSGGFTVSGGLVLSNTNGYGAKAEIADIDGDGDVEAIITGATGDGVTVAFHVLDHTGYLFTINGIESTDLFAWALGDIDGDGRADFAINPGVAQPHLLFFRSTGAGFEPFPDWMEFPTTSGATLTQLDLADLDADGAADLLLVDNSTETPTLHTGSADGGFPFPAIGHLLPEAVVFSPTAAFGDVDGDGLVDLVRATGGQYAQIELRRNTSFVP